MPNLRTAAAMLCTVTLVALFAMPRAAFAQAEDQVAEPEWTTHFYAGELAQAERTLLQRLREAPDDDQARFGLGAARFLRAVENLMQGAYRFGLRPDDDIAMGTPMLALPVLANPDPQPVTYEMLRTQLKGWVSDLESVEETLAPIDDDGVTLPLRFGLIRLDFDGDGEATDQETLWHIYAQLNRGMNEDARAAAEQFTIVFDAADVHWLRGYCHLLAATSEMALAHDWEALFNRTAHLYFAKPDTPFPFLSTPREESDRWGMWNRERISDVIAMVHLLDFEVTEPRRMGAALDHLQAVVEQSRASWDLILDESDDQREWIPGPHQTGVIPGIEVTDEMVQQWRRFLDEGEALLAGDKLLPFWRTGERRGVNLHRVFTEPRGFDLVLWFQGTAAAPYLEEGEITEGATWREFQQAFGGQFVGFAIWFN